MDAQSKPAEVLEFIQTNGISDNKPDEHGNVGYTLPDGWPLSYVMGPFMIPPTHGSPKSREGDYKPEVGTPEYHVGIAWYRSQGVDGSRRYFDAEAMRHIKLWAEGPVSEQPRHSPDFASVHWYGANYTFTGNQAAIVKVLWEAWLNGTPDVSSAYLLAKAESSCKKLAEVFRDARMRRPHPAWDTMICGGELKGTRRLQAPQTSTINAKPT